VIKFVGLLLVEGQEHRGQDGQKGNRTLVGVQKKLIVDCRFSMVGMAGRDIKHVVSIAFGGASALQRNFSLGALELNFGYPNGSNIMISTKPQKK
jgi:hypothetical protein